MKKPEYVKTPLVISVSPAPCRMICVQVLKMDDGLSVTWNPVVGLLCGIDNGHQTPNGIEWTTEVKPVLALGDNTESESGLFVLDWASKPSNVIYCTTSPAEWPPEDDEKNAIRLAKAMVKGKGECINPFVSLPNDITPESIP